MLLRWDRGSNRHAIGDDAVRRLLIRQTDDADKDEPMTQQRWIGARPPSSGPLPWLLGIATIFLLREAAPVMLPAAIAVLLAFLLSAPVQFLRRHGVPEVIGAALVIGLIAWGIISIALALLRPAATWFANAPGNVERLLAAFEHLRDRMPVLKSFAGATGDASSLASLQQRMAEQLIGVTQTAVAHAGRVGFGLISTIFLLYFMLISQRGLLPHVVGALPNRRQRVGLVRALRDVRDDIGRYLGVMVFMNLMLGITTAIAFRFIGLAEPTFWGILAGTLNFVPYVGPVLMYLLLFTAGVLQFDSVGMTFAPCIAFGIASMLESGMASPWLIGQRMRIHKLLVFFSVLFWAWMWGIGGTVVGVPILIGIRAAVRGRRRNGLLRALLNPDDRPPPRLGDLLRMRGEVPDASAKGKRDPARIEAELRKLRRR